MSDATILSDEQTGTEAVEQLDALCARVRALESALRKCNEIVEEAAHANIALRKQLATVTQERDEERRLRAELKQIAQTGISEVSSVGAALKDNALIDFRLRVVQLVKGQAEAWLADSRSEVSDERSNMMYERCTAARQLAEELEKLE